MKTFLKILLFTIFFIFAIAMGILAINEKENIDNLNKNGIFATAVVTDIKTKTPYNSNSKKEVLHYPVFTFETKNGDKIIFTSKIGSSKSRFDIGERVEVVYQEENPYNATDTSFLSMWFPVLIAGFFSILILLILSVFSMRFIFSKLSFPKKSKSFKIKNNGIKNISMKDDITINMNNIKIQNSDDNDPRRLMPK